jgi:DNA-binding transcriptional ArsR family regulator
MVVRTPQFPASDGTADRVFAALSDPTRRDIVHRTMRQPESVSALARRYPMSVTAVQKHVAVLEAAGLIRKVRRGREQLVHAEVDALRQARALLDDFEAMWRARLDRFADVLATTRTSDAPGGDA